MAKDREHRGYSGRRPGTCKRCGCFDCGSACNRGTRPPKIQITIPVQDVTPPSEPPGPDYDAWECDVESIAECTMYLGAPSGFIYGSDMETAGMPETHRPAADSKVCVWYPSGCTDGASCTSHNAGAGICGWGGYSTCSWSYVEPCDDFPDTLYSDKEWCEASCYVISCGDGCECRCGLGDTCYSTRGLRTEGGVQYFWGRCLDGVSTDGDMGEPMLEPPHGASDPCPSYTDPSSFECDYVSGWGGCYGECDAACSDAAISTTGALGAGAAIYLYEDEDGNPTFAAIFAMTCWSIALAAVYPSAIVWIGKVTFDGNCDDFSVNLPWTMVYPDIIPSDPEIECTITPSTITITNMPD